MGKASMCIRMLQILNTGRTYQVSELANLLETNPRNIIEYKRELDEVASENNYEHYIDVLPGRYGGYRLDGRAIIPALKLTQDEAQSLIDSYNYSYGSHQFVDKNNLVNAYAKIFSNLDIDITKEEIPLIDKTNVYKRNEQVKKWFKIIEQAIKDKTPLLIRYQFLKEPTHVTKVHPYKLFIYDGEWRFFAWSCEVNDIFYYKLSRIEDIQFNNDPPFRVYKYFKFENYIKDGVFTQSGELFDITLIASGIRAKLFKEKDYGKNQVCEDLPDGTTKVTLQMQKNESTYNFLLSCGDLIEVKSPEWLVEKIKSRAQAIVNKYK